MMLAAMWVGRGQQHQRYKGIDAHMTRATMLALRWQRQGRGAGNDASACRDCFVTGQMPVSNAGDKAKASGQRCQHDKGKSAHATRATTPAQRRLQGQQHAAGDDAITMREKRKHNAGKRQHGTGLEGQLGDNAGATLATRTA